MFIDTHAHLASPPLIQEAPSILEKAKSAKIETIVNICVDKESLENIEKLKGSPVPIFHTAATTPHDVEKDGERFFPLVEKALKEKKLIAVGETGLDYFYEHSPKKLQQDYLKKYFLLAKEFNVPTVIHCREAFEDLFAIADQCQVGSDVLLHCFTGSLEEAMEAISRGWLVSFSGIVTFKKSQELQKVAEKLPLSSMVLETDAPYLAPVPHRGKVNEPALIVHTAEFLASLKSCSLEELAKETTQNAKRFFSAFIQ